MESEIAPSPNSKGFSSPISCYENSGVLTETSHKCREADKGTSLMNLRYVVSYERTERSVFKTVTKAVTKTVTKVGARSLWQ